MIKQFIALYIIVLCSTNLLQAQEPNHFFLGNDHFSGIQIYDLVQDDDLNYWIVTNHGLFAYDGYEFSHIENQKVSAASLFNLRKDQNGHIYFNDLNGFVYRIKDRELELFYEIDRNQDKHNVFLDISKTNDLLIQAEHLTIYDGEGFQTIKYDIPSSKSRISFSTLNDGSSICMTGKQTVLYKDGVVQTEDTKSLEDGRTPSPTAWINVNGKDFGIDQKTMELYAFSSQSKSFSYIKTLNDDLLGNALRVYAVHDEIWLIGSRNGIYVYDLEWNPKNNGEAIFQDYFISDVYTNHEGNVLLSTFDEGIIVLPNINLRSYSVAENSKISDITFFNDGYVLVGTDKGALVLQKGTQEQNVYTSNNGESVDFVAYSLKYDMLVFATPTGFAFAKLDQLNLNIIKEFPGAIKSACFGENKCFVALNSGIVSIDLETFELSRIDGLNNRAYDVEIGPSSESIYAVMIDGLYVKHSNKDAQPVKHEGNIVRASEVERIDNSIYIGTDRGQLMVIENEDLWISKSFGSPIKHIVGIGGDLFVKTLNETYILEIENDSIYTTQSTYGINLKQVTDVSYNNGEMLFVEDRRYSLIKRSEIDATLPALNIELIDVKVGGVSTNENRFPYSTENYAFYFRVSTIKYRESVRYQYQLKGWNDNWSELDYAQNTVQFISLPPGNYVFTVKAVNGTIAGKPESFEFIVDAPYYQKPWFLIAIILALSLLFFGYYRYRLGLLSKKNHEEIERQKLATDLLEMELKALRSQMNPHFIFNALNSIQNLVLKEDIDNSYDYLVMFAKLVRNTLNYSDLNFIPIEKEIEFLEIYLSLETLRMKEGFRYEIKIDKSIDFDVPPLIIQPFVENAIVHGLLHKNGDKQLTIEFDVDEYLTCTITDNGVGRNRAKEIQERSKLSEHKSFALRAIQQRLDLLNKQIGEKIGGYDIVDLYHDEQPVGTRVILKLPIRWKY